MAKNQVFGDYEHWSMVLIYDPTTGDIVHSHQVVTTGGATPPDQDALEREAADHASRASGRSVEGMAFLHIDPREIDLAARYAVDVKSRSLIQVGAVRT